AEARDVGDVEREVDLVPVPEQVALRLAHHRQRDLLGLLRGQRRDALVRLQFPVDAHVRRGSRLEVDVRGAARHDRLEKVGDTDAARGPVTHGALSLGKPRGARCDIPRGRAAARAAATPRRRPATRVLPRPAGPWALLAPMVRGARAPTVTGSSRGTPAPAP